jgi:hypothetical protein
VNWSPTLDEQAQDRSYRIGQERDVDVVRLGEQFELFDSSYKINTL